MTSSQHYALVPCSNGGSNPLFVKSSSDQREEDPRSELIDLYQTYADMYPNPRLIEEIRLQDMLLQASSAARTANDNNTKTTKRPGFFTRWFGTRDDLLQAPPPPPPTASSYSSGDPLIYTDMENEIDDGSLCGTMQSIDLSCIPTEVYSLARFHLASTRTKREQPNALSEGITSGSSSATTTTTAVVVGLGEIAEFSTSGEPHVSTTSDREELLAYANATQEYELHYVRATVLAPNCIAVSWGFMDGIVVLYRRIHFDNLDYGWKAVWMLGPSDQVLEDMSTREFFHDEKDHPGSPLLRISDCLPLQVETGEQYEPIVMTFALARLGGYIELIPIPQDIWNGPVLTKENHQTPSSPRRKRNMGQHYSSGRPIESPSNTLALTTAHCHIDIISLQALRTSVTADSHWDNNAFPNSPPSEYIVCASGMNQEGYETVSFWATSTIFSEAPDQQSGIAVQLHSTLIEVISAETGAEVTVFATPGIMQRWRTPRNIQISRNATNIKGHNLYADGTKNNNNDNATRISTISTTAPMVTLRFFQNNDSQGRPFLALLDWNGGITVLDCAVLERLAAQSVSQEEYDLYQNADDQEPFPLVTCLATRSQFVDALQTIGTTKNKIERTSVDIGNLNWVSPTEAQEMELDFPPLVLLLSELGKLAIVTLAETTSVASVTFPGKGAAMKMCREGRLSLVSTRKGKSGSSLKYFTMQQLQPLEIIQSLARDSKFEEAIQAASKLSDHDQAILSNVIESCHLQVWKTKRDVKSLAALRDVSNIVCEALLVCASDAIDGDLTLESLRVVCQLAIAMGSNSHALREQIVSIGAFLVKLGTFELLCRLFSMQPSLIQFRKKFHDVPIVELAKGLAQRAEIAGLSIVVFRHKLDIGDCILDVLERIPLSVDPISFMHLLPLTNETISDTFLNSIDSTTEGAMHWSNMPHFVLDRNGTHVVLNSSDEKNILYYQKFNLQNSAKFNKVSVAIPVWFLERAKMMQTFVGNIQNVISFCELGLRCSGTSMDKEQASSSPPIIQWLYQCWRSASILQRLLMDGVAFSVDDSSIFTIHTDDFLLLDVVEVVHLVLRGQIDTEQIVDKCTNILQPLISDISWPKTPGESSNLDPSISSYCISLVQDCCKSDVNEHNMEQWAQTLKKATSVCVAIATTSTTSIHQDQRLIKDKSELIEMVLWIMQEVARALEETEVPLIIARDIVGSFWSFYETMPADVPATGDLEDTEGLLLSEKIKFAAEALVGVDIIAEWPGCKPFAFFSQLHRFRRRPTSDFSPIGVGTVAQLCRSFHRQIHHGLGREACFSLLHDLLSDLTQLNRICFQGEIAIPAVLADILVPSLLRNEDFDILAAFIGGHSDLVDKDKVKSAILEFFEEAVFSGSEENCSNVASAMKCQDIIGPVFVEIRPAFSSVRRFLDASHFINTVIFAGFDDMEPVSPTKVRRTLPLDLIECVLGEVPESVICGCLQWMDRVYARDTNALLRQVLGNESKQGGVVPRDEDLPVLPGGAIFHLATILGLEDVVSATVVKCCVIRYARGEGMQGAAAAICRTLVRDVDQTTLGTEAIALAKLGAVASVVNDELYSDISTKIELCHAALQSFQGRVNLLDSSSFKSIVRASASLDLLSSRFSSEQQNVPADRQENLLSRPLARLYRCILSEYNSDLHQLFTDLLSQVSEGTVHDSLINALSRFVVYWCVSDSKTLKPRIDLDKRNDAGDNLALGCSLILHIPSNLTSINCVYELQKIAADQAGTVSTEERFGSHNGIYIPDTQIVKRLMERGYSGNAACFAAIMTENQGYNDALSWAVAHPLDHNINLPLLNFRVPGRQLIDEDAIQKLQKALTTMNRILKYPESMASFLNFLSQGCQDASPRPAESTLQQNRGKKFEPKPISLGQKLKKVSEMESKLSHEYTSSALPSPGLQIQSKNNREQASDVSSSMEPQTSGKERQATSKPRQPHLPVALSKDGPPLRQNLQHSKIGKNLHSRGATKSSGTLDQKTRSKVTLMRSGKVPFSERLELRTEGKAAISKLRNLTTSDDRKRLVEEGRQFFRQTKMNGLSSVSKASLVINPLAPPKPSAPAAHGAN
jgi:hypothetical protein